MHPVTICRPMWYHAVGSKRIKCASCMWPGLVWFILSAISCVWMDCFRLKPHRHKLRCRKSALCQTSITASRAYHIMAYTTYQSWPSLSCGHVSVIFDSVVSYSNGASCQSSGLKSSKQPRMLSAALYCVTSILRSGTATTCLSNPPIVKATVQRRPKPKVNCDTIGLPPHMPNHCLLRKLVPLVAATT